VIVRCRTPLRLGLAGGGTDVSPYCDTFGGAVLNATIDLYAHCTIEPSLDGKIRFVAIDRNEEVEFDISAGSPQDCTLSLHAAAYNRIVSDFNKGAPLAVTVSTYCEARAGSGLGSSSTLVVSMIQAYAEYLSLGLGDYDVARLAFVVERQDAGLHGGRQDQYAATFGGFNFMEFNSDDRVLVNPLRVKPWIISELESSLVLFYTGRSRESAAIIVEESKNVVERRTDAVNAMHQSKEEAYRMKECLLRGRIKDLGSVMESAWAAKKRMASSISNESLDRYHDIAVKAGAYCGKVSGAGGGGFMMFLADPKKRLNVTNALLGSSNGIILGCHFTKTGSMAWRVE
jgi:D-glycero-alpha-D-manno-heptose-7-phosphate kinase